MSTAARRRQLADDRRALCALLLETSGEERQRIETRIAAVQAELLALKGR